MPVPPRISTSAAVSPTVPANGCVPAGRSPVTYTVAPCSAKARAMPLPIPRLAPVTTATRPANERSRGEGGQPWRLVRVSRMCHLTSPVAPTGVVVAAERHTHQALGPVRGRAEVLEPVIEHGAFGDAPLLFPAFQPVQIAPADDGVDLVVAHIDAVYAITCVSERAASPFRVMRICPRMCCVITIAGEPRRTQSR